MRIIRREKRIRKLSEETPCVLSFSIDGDEQGKDVHDQPLRERRVNWKSLAEIFKQTDRHQAVAADLRSLARARVPNGVGLDRHVRQREDLPYQAVSAPGGKTIRNRHGRLRGEA